MMQQQRHTHTPNVGRGYIRGACPKIVGMMRSVERRESHFRERCSWESLPIDSPKLTPKPSETEEEDLSYSFRERTVPAIFESGLRQGMEIFS